MGRLQKQIGELNAKTTVQTEGWITYLPPSFWPDARTYVPETEFTETAQTYGGIPRKQGIQTIKKLWAILLLTN